MLSFNKLVFRHHTSQTSDVVIEVTVDAEGIDRLKEILHPIGSILTLLDRDKENE